MIGGLRVCGTRAQGDGGWGKVHDQSTGSSSSEVITFARVVVVLSVVDVVVVVVLVCHGSTSVTSFLSTPGFAFPAWWHRKMLFVGVFSKGSQWLLGRTSREIFLAFSSCAPSFRV